MEEPALTKICRACLTEEGEMKSVFIPDERAGTNLHLAEMIMAYASVQITLGDGLPEQICVPCAEKVSNTYVFKQLCEESDELLRQRYEKSPYSNKETNIHEPEMTMTESVDIVIKPEIDLHVEHSDDEFVDNIEMLDDDFSERQQYIQQDDSDSDYDPKKPRRGCDICNKKFFSERHLKRHRAMHTHVKHHVCDICNKIFLKQEVFEKHKLTHHGEEEDDDDDDEEEDDEPLTANIKVEMDDIDTKQEDSLSDEEIVPIVEYDADGNLVEKYQCAVCQKDFPKKEGLTSHMRTHNLKTNSKDKDKVLVCHVCSKKFMKPSHLNRHLKIHSTVKAHVCTLCNKGFARGEQLINHMNLHTGIKPHVCNICNKGFNQISNLKDHLRTHNGEKPFLCSTCGKGFNQLGNLRQHTIRHSGIKAHLCSICGNGFASKGELGAHLRKHTGARPFVCAVCNHGFTTSSSLTKHKRIHSGEKPYQCEVCKMKFSRSGILARHKRTHTGEKPYVCKFCTKAFAQSNDLSSHLRIHTGEKPFICDVCGQAFRQSSALKTHKKTHMDRGQILPAHEHIERVHMDRSRELTERAMELAQIDREHAQMLDNKAAITMMHTTLLNNVNVNVSLP